MDKNEEVKKDWRVSSIRSPAEVWKEIPSCEEGYFVSNYGNVKYKDKLLPKLLGFGDGEPYVNLISEDNELFIRTIGTLVRDTFGTNN